MLKRGLNKTKAKNQTRETVQTKKSDDEGPKQDWCTEVKITADNVKFKEEFIVMLPNNLSMSDGHLCLTKFEKYRAGLSPTND